MIAIPRLPLLLVLMLLAVALPASADDAARADDAHDHAHPTPHATHADETTPQPSRVSPYTGAEATADDAPHADHEADPMHALHNHSPITLTRDRHAAFAEQVDVSTFARLAVFDGGRAKIVDTLAREQLNRIYGKPRWRDDQVGQRYAPTFTYLDLLFNKRYYNDKPMIHVEVLPLRRQMVAHLPADEQETWLRRGRLSPQLIRSPQIQALLAGQGADLRHFQAQQQVVDAAGAFDHFGARLNLISPTPGDDAWHHVAGLLDPETYNLSASNAEAADAAREHLLALAQAWRQTDADAANAALAGLAEHLPRINADTYPPAYQMQVEAIYNATSRFTIGFYVYLLATITLLIAFAVSRRWLATTGLALLIVGFIIHSGGIAARAVLTHRWPIHNQYESFVAVAWFAVLLGLVLMIARRQWLFGAAAAALGSLTLLTAHMIQIPSHEAAPVAAILTTSRILYIHVNIVLASYAMIALAFTISLFYLGVHYFSRGGGSSNGSGGTPATTRHTNDAAPGSVALQSGAPGVLQFTATGLSAFDADADNAPLRGRAALLNDLDKAQMVVLQLAFWTLGVGILLGAYWADHAWGRWWAWDPKETWALITWIIYLIAIHVRLGVTRRGLVTAWLSTVGFFVMLWCYWGVNLLLAGLHSYA